MYEKKKYFPPTFTHHHQLFPNFSKKFELFSHFSMKKTQILQKKAKKLVRPFYAQDFLCFVSAETQSISAEILQFQLKKNLPKKGAFFQSAKKVFSLLDISWKYPLRTLFKNFHHRAMLDDENYF